MIHSELLPDQGILLSTPEGPLQESDFAMLTKLVDPYIETNGELHGILIHTQSFPGWSDFAALLSHLKFVKNHHSSLRWNDIDFNASQIHIFRPKVNSEFIMHMTSRVKEMLQRRYKGRNSEWVFPNKEGKPKRCFGSLRRIIKKAGFDEATLHTARHTTATRLVQRGTSLYEVSHILGHSSMQMTTRYAHLSKMDVSKRAAETLEGKENNQSTYSDPQSYTNSYTDKCTTISISSDISGSVLETIKGKE